jgi:PAS domain S-box-containing protein
VGYSVSFKREYMKENLEFSLSVLSDSLKKNSIESADRFCSLIEAIPQMAWISRPDGDLAYLNKAWYDYTGALEINECDWGKYLYAEDHQHTYDRWMFSLRTGEVFDIEYRWIRYDGMVRWMLGRAKPVKNTQGEIVLWIGTATDIHEQKMNFERLTAVQEKLNKFVVELSHKNKELVNINSDLDNFIYTASHDLKSPISNIEGLMLTLKDELKGNPNDDVHTLLSMVDRSVERFKSTIKDLTEITKIQKNISEDILENVSFKHMMDDVNINLQSLIEEISPVIIVDFKIPGVKFSRKNLRSIMFNLISNAIKYSCPSRRCKITIETQMIGNEILLSVKDNGLGIRESNKDNIFKMFKRMHDHVEGSGVGLYIVKRIIDNAGGKIEVISKEGEGSEFKIYFKA